MKGHPMDIQTEHPPPRWDENYELTDLYKKNNPRMKESEDVVSCPFRQRGGCADRSVRTQSSLSRSVATTPAPSVAAGSHQSNTSGTIDGARLSAESQPTLRVVGVAKPTAAAAPDNNQSNSNININSNVIKQFKRLPKPPPNPVFRSNFVPPPKRPQSKSTKSVATGSSSSKSQSSKQKKLASPSNRSRVSAQSVTSKVTAGSSSNSRKSGTFLVPNNNGGIEIDAAQSNASSISSFEEPEKAFFAKEKKRSKGKQSRKASKKLQKKDKQKKNKKEKQKKQRQHPEGREDASTPRGGGSSSGGSGNGSGDTDRARAPGWMKVLTDDETAIDQRRVGPPSHRNIGGDISSSSGMKSPKPLNRMPSHQSIPSPRSSAAQRYHNNSDRRSVSSRSKASTSSGTKSSTERNNMAFAVNSIVQTANLALNMEGMLLGTSGATANKSNVAVAENGVRNSTTPKAANGASSWNQDQHVPPPISKPRLVEQENGVLVRTIPDHMNKYKNSSNEIRRQNINAIANRVFRGGDDDSVDSIDMLFNWVCAAASRDDDTVTAVHHSTTDSTGDSTVTSANDNDGPHWYEVINRDMLNKLAKNLAAPSCQY
mmetsp:Transcript_25897/g.72264  ORF Transcript_25897/g.72264 Transcript_25897/m.72264 type:complete len:599 (-) Transcript_25897:208-2004(-)|eukprot:CAMPEP_0119566928 /NCGR_PEP_ID=MMETSP1352-20130426/34491_1 /TAXON_ID=265584 /ORGANISM="Stauroneis constricta, Strain CCMP1120" /LENGTH=598 /DNA_ID=CAMNT_0007616115 /DNA_START=45 /DNA_END=1841 /DNA_ORIENTATION=-